MTGPRNKEVKSIISEVFRLTWVGVVGEVGK